MDVQVVALTHAREHQSAELRYHRNDGYNKLMLFCHMKPELGEFVRKGVKSRLTLFFVRFYRSTASDNADERTSRVNTLLTSTTYELSTTFLVNSCLL
jgi:hypothetical protein